MKATKCLSWAAGWMLLATAPVCHAAPQEPESQTLDQVRAAIEVEDYPKALAILKPAAAAGDVRSQFLLGVAYYQGVGTAKDVDQAANWFERAAAGGDKNAQHLLGKMYLNGIAYPRNERVAAELLEKSALQGVAEAQYILGLLLSPLPVQDEQNSIFSNLSSIPKDPVASARWHRMAADQGHAHAQFSLALAYERGSGVAKSMVEAINFYRLAAKQGTSRAQHNLAVMYLYGEGTERNIVKAYMWMVIAATTDQRNLSAARDEIAAKLSPSQVRKAEAEAARCLENHYVGCD